MVLGCVVVGEEPVLEVLAGVGEVETEQLGLAARAGVLDVGVEPHHVATEGDRGVPHRGVASDQDRVAAQVDGVVVPVLQASDVDLGAVADEHRGGRAVARRPGVHETIVALAWAPNRHTSWPQTRSSTESPVQPDHDRLVDLGLGRHVEQRAPPECSRGERGGPVVGRHLAELARLVGGDLGQRHPLGQRRRPRPGSRRTARRRADPAAA